jgi:hypothetical protein
MIRLVYLVRRRPELSLQEFHRIWRDEHGPLVASHQTRLGMRRYTQSHRVEDQANEAMAASRGGMEAPYDGVAEAWWESEAALAGGSVSAAAQLLADEARFIDLPRSPLWLAEELPQVSTTADLHVVARPRSGIVKLHFPLRHVEGLSLEEAQRDWRMNHGPLIRSLASAMGLLRYTQVHRVVSPIEDALRGARRCVVEPYTGHAEVWVDRSVRHAGPEATEAGRLAIEDEARFIDFRRSAMWFGKEHVFVDRW